MAGASSHCVEKSCLGTTIIIDSPRDGSEPQLSAVCFTDHAPVYNFNLIKGTVCYTVWLMHHAILQRGRVLKVSPSPIQGHGSIPDSDSIKSGTVTGIFVLLKNCPRTKIFRKFLSYGINFFVLGQKFSEKFCPRTKIF